MVCQAYFIYWKVCVCVCLFIYLNYVSFTMNCCQAKQFALCFDAKGNFNICILLITIFATHSLQARFNQAWLSHGLNLCIIFYFILLSMTQAHAIYWGKLRNCGLEDMSRFLLNLLHECSPCMLPNGHGTLVVSQTHVWGLVPKNSTSKELLFSGWLWPNFSTLPFFA